MLWLLAESTSILPFEHPIGGGVSVLGAFLLGIGWVGRKRLERWDECVANFAESAKMLRQRLPEFAVRVYATVGEICGALGDVFGGYTETSVL